MISPLIGFSVASPVGKHPQRSINDEGDTGPDLLASHQEVGTNVLFKTSYVHPDSAALRFARQADVDDKREKR